MAVIFYPPRNTGGGGGAATWGSITGTLSAQTDLQTELNAKANTSVLANYLLKSSNLSDVANVATARNNLGLGSIALQNSNSVTITGGNITGLTSLTVTNPSASQISVGNSADITLRTSGTGTLQLVNQAGTVYSRMVSGSRFDWLSNSASTPYSYELNNASNLIYFSKYIRNRTTGNSTWFDDKVVNTTGVLTTTDSCLDAWHIVPTSGVAIENLIAHRVTTASTTVPTSAMEFRTMSNGGGVALFRVGGGINGVYFGSDVTSSATRIGLIYNNNTGYNLTFPPTAGTNGQMLQTDGTGTLSWVTPSGGGGSNVTLSYVRNIVNNLNTGFNFSFIPNGTQEVFGIASTGRVFWGVTDASSAVAYTAATVNGTYSQIALTNNGSGSGGFIFDIGPSAEGFVYYRSAAIANWTRWNGTSMVAVTTYPSPAGSVNPGTGLGYNGNFAFVAFATPEVMRYSTDNADTWANGSSSWFHTSGTQHNSGYIAIGVVGSGSTWVIITQLQTNPVSANCSYGAISGTPTKQLFPNGYINPQAFTSNGTVMYVYFENGMLGRTTDGANWTYLAVGNGETLTTSPSWNLVIRSSDVLLISNAKVYSIAQDLSAVNWIRLVDNIGGTTGSTRKNHQKIGVISNELYIPATSGIVTNSIGYISSSIEKYTFA